MRVAINGFGRIGRAFVRASYGKGVDVVAINDIGSPESLAYLLKYDTVYGRAPFPVELKDRTLRIGDMEAKLYSEKDPGALPWKSLAVDVVVESTGIFNEYEKAALHIKAGAKKVVITAPAKGDAPQGISSGMVLMGINDEKLKTCQISSNASCTTNAASPLIAILDEAIGIEKAVLSTVHAYTASQALVDGPSRKELREGRAAAQNIVPSSTGAAVAVTKVYEGLAGKFDGISLRVPVPAGSIADITFIAKRETSADEVNDILRKAAKEPRWEGIYTATDDELVSSDIVGEHYGAIADLSMTRVIGGNLVKVLSWYDNEMGYVATLVKHVLATGREA
ncbi:MAG: type I glyceraldehyde-3-phosphate dehydrogenase [Patescibacteria group bacterium]|nr:type I glyceraldehyde-3-phosphate dehydrogenase [Patescibacteria group bacterium]